jgi:ATP-binding cassette subfamily C protein CydCD
VTSDRRGPLDHDLIRRVPALRRHLFICAIAAGLAATLIVAQAEVVARTLVSVVDGRSTSLLVPIMLLLAAGGGRAVTTAAIEWSGATAMRHARLGLRRAVLDHAAVDAARERPGVATSEATMATSGIDRLDPYIRDYLPALTMSVAVPLAAGARIFSLDWISAAIVAVTVPLIPVFMVLIGQLTERRSRRQWALLQRLAGHFLDVLEGLPTLRLFGRAKAQAAAVRRISDDYRSATVSTLRVAFLSALALELLATLSVAVVAVSIGLRLAGGSVELEPALVILLLAPECYLPLRRVGAAFHAAEAGHDASDELGAVLDGPVFPSGRARPGAAAGLVVRGLGTTARCALIDGLDLDLASSTVTVLQGPSGTGKSTVLSALRGRLAGRTGEITIDGVELATVAADCWAEQVVLVDQRPEPLMPTVAAEVRGATDRGPAAVAGALASVGLSGIEHRDPATLSGGQLRRIQVARAIVAVTHGPARLVLADEPTAQLDQVSADAVRTALTGLAHDAGAVVVVATHDAGWRPLADVVVDLVDPIHTQVEEVGDEAVPPSTPVDEFVALAAPGDLANAAAADPALVVDAGRRWEHLRILLRPLRGRMAFAAGLAILAEVCTLGLAGAAAWLIVRASERPDLAALAVAVTGVRAFAVGKGVFRYAERLASHDVGFRLLGSVRAQLVDRLADVAPIPGWQRGDLLRRLVDDVDQLLDLTVRIVVPWTAFAVTSMGAAIVVGLLDPGAGLVMVGTIGLVGLVVPVFVARHERRVGPQLAESRAVLTDRVLDVTQHIDQLVGSGLLGRARGHVDNASDAVEHLERGRNIERTVTRSLLTACPALSVAAIFAVMGNTPGVSAPVYGVLVLWPLAIVELLATVADGARTLPGLAASAHRVDGLLALRRDDTNRSELETGSPPSVALDSMRARWPGSDLTVGPYTLELPACGWATVTGPSGSGKSTLAAAMVRFCPIVEGKYTIGDSDALAADPEGVRSTVLWIDQHPWIGDSTLRENLKIGDPAATDERLRAVLAIVELDGWLDRLPRGLDTRVGRRGHAMSGGEAHRVGLARALLARHSVVVLDEPVSHLDADMGERVLASISSELGNRSVLTLGHEPVDIRSTARPPEAHDGSMRFGSGSTNRSEPIGARMGETWTSEA